LRASHKYREKAAAGNLTQIAPRRFNPEGEAWLPIFTLRGASTITPRSFQTARAHEQGKTRDWVVLFCDNGDTENRFTVITSEFGRLQGQRIVAGREAECDSYTVTTFAYGKASNA
jgi:DNA polymerase (family X)